uniref:Fucosyltransferase n=1 Tax=Astyanax mexicanus TaxID=7994 RepID=A0A3B1JGX4_ASTMX
SGSLPVYVLICYIQIFFVLHKSSLNSNQLSPKEAAVVQENTSSRNASSPNTIVLVWPWPFGYSFDSESCGPTYGITGCHLTDDRSVYGRAHVVMFHHRDISGLVMCQRWVWMNMESPDFSASVPSMDNLFNLTASFRRDSDIWVPYGQLVGISEEDEPFRIPTKDKLVCWIVSHWKSEFKRVQYFEELRQHMEVNAYGHSFGKHMSDQDFQAVIPSCKFYLSFENSVYKDYITEKLFNPMIMGSVPVVLGPSRENYEEFIPADSFIHVDDFKTPKELAEHLKLLDQNQEMYEQYFAWRKHFVARRSDFGLEHACRICDHIKRNKGYRVFKNLNKWYWG